MNAMSSQTNKDLFDVAIVGGFGHVGLPLGISFAHKGLKVCLYDIDKKNGELIKQGTMPFMEYGAEEILKGVLQKKMLDISSEPGVLSKARHVIIAIGTPVDEYLNPKVRPFLELFTKLRQHLNPEQTIIIRSTVYPRTCQQVARLLGKSGGVWHIAYCPERIVQGHAVEELEKLPQIVAGLTDKAIKDASELFGVLSPKIIKVSIEEAELIKLYSNAWRYIQFAVANQFYMIAHSFGVDFERVRHAMMEGYGRAATLPGAGFAAGPCLLKDTMQLSAFYNNNFLLGHTAMMVNEGLPNFIVEDLRRRYDLSRTRVGILGMAFKADIDDIRDSLSFKLGKILRFNGAKVYYSDEYAKNPDFVCKEELIKLSDVVIVGVPHSAYKDLDIPENIEVVDLWGVIRRK